MIKRFSGSQGSMVEVSEMNNKIVRWERPTIHKLLNNLEISAIMDC